MKLWVGIRAEIKNEIAALEKFGNENEMRPSICGKAHNQIWQCRISRVPLGTQKTCMDFSIHALSLRRRKPPAGVAGRALTRPPSPYQARVNQLCLFSASRPFTTIPASASFFSRLPVIMGVATSRPISAAWL